MSSETTMMAEQYRLREWADQIRDCQSRPSGMSVVSWCACHGITKANYYYRPRRVREACLETIQGGITAQQVVPVQPGLLQQQEQKDGNAQPGLDISIKGGSIHVTESTPMPLLAGCWSHARRRFDEAVKALPKAKQKDSRAYLALTMVQTIYREEKLLKYLPAGERKIRRQLSVRPLVEAYFVWVRENLPKVPQKSKTWEGFSYSLNQEKYLKVFLDDGEVPMDNNAAEQSIRGFCIGKKNWVMIDTVAGAKSSAIIYSIAETAKANNLKPYDYFEYLLTEIPKHLDDTDRSFLDDLLPWSPNLPANCRKDWSKSASIIQVCSSFV